MDHFLSRAVETGRPSIADSGEEGSPAAGRLREATDDDLSLSAIDRVVRSLGVSSPLSALLPDAAGLSPGSHHADSGDVLNWCRRRHPDWTELPEQTVRAVYQRLLYDRWATSVLWRIANELPATIDRVLASVSRLAPDGCDDDLWWGTPTCRLTKQQRWRCRAKLKQRAAHLGIDAWWAGVPAADPDGGECADCQEWADWSR
jgi:hypothetical protein